MYPKVFYPAVYFLFYIVVYWSCLYYGSLRLVIIILEKGNREIYPKPHNGSEATVKIQKPETRIQGPAQDFLVSHEAHQIQPFSTLQWASSAPFSQYKREEGNRAEGLTVEERKDALPLLSFSFALHIQATG